MPGSGPVRFRLLGVPCALAAAGLLALSQAVYAPPGPPVLPSTPSPTARAFSEQPSFSPPLASPTIQGPSGSPASAGINEQALAGIDSMLSDYVASGLFPGAVVLVARNGVVVKHSAYGNAAVWASEGEPLERPVSATVDTMFDVASLTKLYVSTAALTLVQQGKLNLDTPVASYLPEFAAGGKDAITTRHLLSHTAGLPAGLRLWERGGTVEERIAAALRLEVTTKPGSKYTYSDAGPIYAGLIIERITGQKLEEYLRDAVLTPMGMANTTYNPQPALKDRIAATEVLRAGNGGVLWGAVHDGEARALNGVSGNAGLFSTAADVARLGQLMLDKGAHSEGILFSPELATQAVTAQPGTDGRRGIGWEIGQRKYMGDLADNGGFGHTGFTGTSVVVNPTENVVVVLLTNHLHPRSAGSVDHARREVANAVYAAIIR